MLLPKAKLFKNIHEHILAVFKRQHKKVYSIEERLYDCDGNPLIDMEPQPVSNSIKSAFSKTAILFVIVSVILFFALVVTTFYPMATELYMWELRLFVIFGFVSWWLNNIVVLRSIKEKGWYRWYSIILSVVTIVLTIVEITCFIIVRCRIFNIVGIMKIWEWQHPVMAHICDTLLWTVLLAWFVQYIINSVFVLKLRYKQS